MGTVNIHEAKTQFSALVERVRSGEEVVIAKSGKPVARLVPYDTNDAPRRELGAMQGQIWMADDFDAPLPASVLAEFLGEGDASGSVVVEPRGTARKGPRKRAPTSR